MRLRALTPGRHPGAGPVVRRRDSPCRGHQPSLPAAPGPRESMPRPAASILGDPQVGSAFGAPGPLPGTFVAPSAGLCGMLPRPPCPGIAEEEFVARPGQRQTGARRTAPRKQRRVRHRGDVVSVLARTVREVEAAARRGRVTPAVRTKFQAVALLLRDERARVRAGGRKRQSPGRAAQAPGRHRDHPRDDRRPGRWAAGAARRGLRRLRRGPVAQAGDAAGPRHRAGARRGRAGRDRDRPRRHRAAGRAAVGDLPAAGEPVPRPRLLRRSAAHLPSAPPGRLGAARPAAELLRARRRGSPGVHGRCRRRRPGSPRRAWS